ncbi:MAG: hypothetical protein KA099_10920 [Alphaproteobacteria bacterium]|nr:hypothetical protein [Alphaproteobacteria bacterium]MBP7757771.1 hypothetical protein [Alphaproteobacteria bacterium]MBP7761029.1 hypothetical protein [Alphaproteobacteria bacterium]MBP7905828.1 hypothetical protein [Alphaproteobacteria bacterium]
MKIIKYVVLFSLFCLSGVHAYAEEAETISENNPCKELEQLQTGGADYVPGVDVDGNAVAPADLEQQVPAVFDPVIIPITVDLAERYGLTLPAGVELKPEVAWMEIYRDGRVLFNGEDVQGRVKTACLLENAENPPEQDGQPSPDPLVSGGN